MGWPGSCDDLLIASWVAWSRLVKEHSPTSRRLAIAVQGSRHLLLPSAATACRCRAARRSGRLWRWTALVGKLATGAGSLLPQPGPADWAEARCRAGALMPRSLGPSCASAAARSARRRDGTLSRAERGMACGCCNWVEVWGGEHRAAGAFQPVCAACFVAIHKHPVGHGLCRSLPKRFDTFRGGYSRPTPRGAGRCPQPNMKDEPSRIHRKGRKGLRAVLALPEFRAVDRAESLLAG